MVIFHSYVSLPEGKWWLVDDDVGNQYILAYHNPWGESLQGGTPLVMYVGYNPHWL